MNNKANAIIKIAISGLFLSMTAVSTSVAQTGMFGPAGIESCDEYVSKAMSQVQMAAGCGFQGPRWTSNSTEHMNWCNRVEPRLRGIEDEARRNALVECRRDSGPVSIPTCDDYTSRAMSQVSLAGILSQVGQNCNFSGPRWTSNSDEHRSWCNRSSLEARRFEDEERRKALAACKVVPGEEPVIK